MGFWDRQARRFDTAPPSPEQDEAVRRAIDHLPSDAHVLEVGCAAGATAQALRPYVASWHGIDISEEMVRRAARRAGDGMTFQQTTVGDPTLRDHGFTAVVAFNVLHFMDLDHDIETLAELVPPGGLLLAQTPCLGEMAAPVRWTLPVVAMVLRVPGLRRLRFAELREAVARRFDLVEEDASRPTRTWLVARRR